MLWCFSCGGNGLSEKSPGGGNIVSARIQRERCGCRPPISLRVLFRFYSDRLEPLHVDDRSLGVSEDPDPFYYIIAGSTFWEYYSVGLFSG